jgi:hypothetical protein
MMSRHAQTPPSAARHQARGVAQRRSRDRAYSERVVGQPQVIRFVRHAARWRRFAGHQLEIQAERDRKLEAAREHRKINGTA